jgi:hypothetical protein
MAGEILDDFPFYSSGSSDGSSGHPLSTHRSTSAFRHRVLPPIRSGAGQRRALHNRHHVRVEIPSNFATSSAVTSKRSEGF